MTRFVRYTTALAAGALVLTVTPIWGGLAVFAITIAYVR